MLQFCQFLGAGHSIRKQSCEHSCTGGREPPGGNDGSVVAPAKSPTFEVSGSKGHLEAAKPLRASQDEPHLLRYLLKLCHNYSGLAIPAGLSHSSPPANLLASRWPPCSLGPSLDIYHSQTRSSHTKTCLFLSVAAVRQLSLIPNYKLPRTCISSCIR